MKPDHALAAILARQEYSLDAAAQAAYMALPAAQDTGANAEALVEIIAAFAVAKREILLESADLALL